MDPRLVLAVLYEEGADSPQPLRPGYDYGRWLNNSVTQKPNGNSLGLANMKEPTFNAVKSAFPKEFEGEEWSDLMGNDRLAIKAATYNLKRLDNSLVPVVPDAMKERYSRNQILLAGYNAEGYFYQEKDGYLVRGELGPAVQKYVHRGMGSWARAEGVLEDMYLWRDEVDTGIYTHNLSMDASLPPDTRIVDIPPAGGYPKQSGPGYIAGSSVPAGGAAILSAWLPQHGRPLLERLRRDGRGYISDFSGSVRHRTTSRQSGRDIVYRELAESMIAGGMGIPPMASSVLATLLGEQLSSGRRAEVARPVATAVDGDAQRMLERARVRRAQQALTYTNRWG
jgi:hypothetical protein